MQSGETSRSNDSRKPFAVRTLTSDDPPKPKIIGIYGLPGSGKTTILRALRFLGLNSTRFTIFDMEDVICQIHKMKKADLERIALEKAGRPEWLRLRVEALRHIYERCVLNGTTGIVDDSLMWLHPFDSRYSYHSWTEKHYGFYSHIVYLDVSPDALSQMRQKDNKRFYPDVTIAHLQQWTNREKQNLRGKCYQHGILMSVVRVGTVPETVSKVLRLINDFQEDSQEGNDNIAITELDRLLSPTATKEVVIIDADGTLSSDNNLDSFCSILYRNTAALRCLFSDPAIPSYHSFRQAALLFDEAVAQNGQQVMDICNFAAAQTINHHEVAALLRHLAQPNRFSTFIITCGLRPVWECVLARLGLLGHIRVLGNAGIGQGYLITPNTKRVLVKHLQSMGRKVTAIGSSPYDLEMLRQADRGIVMVGTDVGLRERMEKELSDIIEGKDIRQLWVVGNEIPLLDTERLKVVVLDEMSDGKEWPEGTVGLRQWLGFGERG